MGKKRVYILYLLNLLAHHFWSLDFPFVSEHREGKVTDEYDLTQAPHQSDSIKEVGISTAGVYPQIIESRPQKGRIQDNRGNNECIPHEREDMSVERHHGQEQ